MNNQSNTNDEEQKVNHQLQSKAPPSSFAANSKDHNSNHQPLATDPGQNQGAALRQAKASVQHQQQTQNGSGNNKWEMAVTSNIGNLAQNKGNGKGNGFQ